MHLKHAQSEQIRSPRASEEENLQKEKENGLARNGIRTVTFIKYINLIRADRTSDSLFSFHRSFTLQTEPGANFVSRVREDFKWLCERLKEEFPNIVIPRVDESKMNQSDIDDFFKNILHKYKLGESRSLIFFLTADKRYFDSRKNRDTSVFKDLLNRVIGPNKLNVKGLGLNEFKKEEDMDALEEAQLGSLADELLEYLAVSREQHRK